MRGILARSNRLTDAAARRREGEFSPRGRSPRISRERVAEFLHSNRIRRESRGKPAWLGLFSKLKYINATSDQEFRGRVVRYCFERGFMLSSVNFPATSPSSQLPVGHLLWDPAREQALEPADRDGCV